MITRVKFKDHARPMYLSKQPTTWPNTAYILDDPRIDREAGVMIFHFGTVMGNDASTRCYRLDQIEWWDGEENAP